MTVSIHLLSYLAQFFLEWEMFQTNHVEKTDTHLLYSTTFFRKSCRLLDNVEKYFEPDRPQITIWIMGIECCILKTANKSSEYVMLIAFPRQ